MNGESLGCLPSNTLIPPSGEAYEVDLADGCVGAPGADAGVGRTSSATTGTTKTSPSILWGTVPAIGV